MSGSPAPFLVAGAALVAMTLTGCGGSPAPADPPSAANDGSGAAPVIDRNFPDPDVLRVDDTYYAYATEDNAKNVQIAESTDLQNWTVLNEDAMPDLPSWVIPGKTWAPEVTEVSEGNYVLYFTATNFDPALQCIGVATATSPVGPFEVQGEGMLVCPEDEGGAIDASTFTDDDGGLHLVWKNDGNCCGLDTWIQTAPLSADGLTLSGEPQKLIKQTLEWEGDLVEAPTIVPRESGYALLYSSNSYGDDRYNVGVATAPTLEGPWEKRDEPILSTESSEFRYLGPGGQDMVTGPEGQDYLIFHGWDSAFTYRGVHTAPLEWDGLMPQVVLKD